MPLLFEWDSKKAASNRLKHGISFEEASTIYGDVRSLTIPDPKHSQPEPRFVTMGLSYAGRVLVVVHTDRQDKIRLISARPAAQKERRQYEAL